MTSRPTAPSTSRTLPPGYTLITSPPSLEAYLKLRTNTGLTPKSAEQASKALAGSWYTTHIAYQNLSSSEQDQADREPQVVAQARIIGDGGWYFHIVDVAVLPSHQRKGLADFMMDHLIAKIEQEAPGNPYINLIADPPANKLYARHGFVETSTVGRRGIGMQRY
jgi:ribosomal protein S18 acetylase RimI-like enzyme